MRSTIHILLGITIISGIPIAIHAQAMTADAECSSLMDVATRLAHIETQKDSFRAWERAYPICQNAGPALRAKSAERWALTLQVWNRPKEAEGVLRRELERLETEKLSAKSYGLAVLDALGGLLDVMGKTDEAFSLAQKSLQLREQAYSPASAEAAEGLVHLGYLYERDKGDRAKAEMYYRRALAIAQTVCAPPCKTLWLPYARLFELIKKQRGREAEAEELSQRMMEAFPRSDR